MKALDQLQQCGGYIQRCQSYKLKDDINVIVCVMLLVE